MRTVFFVVLPEVVLLDVAGAADAFRMANQQTAGSYQLRFTGPVATVRAGVGLQLAQLEALPSTVPDDSIVVIAGVISVKLDLQSVAIRQVVTWLTRIFQNETVKLMCVCSGSLVAAQAGLLQGRECTTHHDFVAKLSSMEPTATVHDNRIFVEDGRICTSAGVTAGTDLAALPDRAAGRHQAAVGVARDMVVSTCDGLERIRSCLPGSCIATTCIPRFIACRMR